MFGIEDEKVGCVVFEGCEEIVWFDMSLVRIDGDVMDSGTPEAHVDSFPENCLRQVS
jgi:hypothetical protein